MHRFAWGLLFVVCAASAVGQSETPVIETRGQATIGVPPDYISFWMTRRESAQTFRDAAKAALKFEETLEKAIDAMELSPEPLEVSGVAIPSLEETEAIVSARVRFTVGSITTRDDLAESFGALCDDVIALGERVGCIVEGPTLGSGQTEGAERNAVARATENALYQAEAIADLMSTRIYSVRHVQVESVSWNTEALSPESLPDINRITCSAAVRVTYAHAP